MIYLRTHSLVPYLTSSSPHLCVKELPYSTPQTSFFTVQLDFVVNILKSFLLQYNHLIFPQQLFYLPALISLPLSSSPSLILHYYISVVKTHCMFFFVFVFPCTQLCLCVVRPTLGRDPGLIIQSLTHSLIPPLYRPDPGFNPENLQSRLLCLRSS